MGAWSNRKIMENHKMHVRVGIGVLVKDPNCPGNIWAGIRQGSHGEGSLALPGGHLEMMESWEECAKREVLEETGLDICDVKFVHVTNNPMPQEGKHYVTIFMSARCRSKTATPRNLEPNKCKGWSSYSWSDLKRISANRSGDNLYLFGPLRTLVEANPQNVLNFLEKMV